MNMCLGIYLFLFIFMAIKFGCVRAGRVSRLARRKTLTNFQI